MNRRQRELIRGATTDVLSARHSDDARQIMTAVIQTYPNKPRDGRRPTRASLIDAAHAPLRACNQILNAANAELVTGKALPTLNECLYRHDTDQPPSEEQLALEAGKYASYSPSLRRFLSALDLCFVETLQQVFAESSRGSMPGAAIQEAASEVYPDFLGIRELWQLYSNNRIARYLRKHGTRPLPTYEAELTQSYEVNTRIAASMLIGRGLAHDALQDGTDKSLFAAGQLSQMAAFSTAAREISLPTMDDRDALLTAYSQWENGDLSAADFRDIQSAWVIPDAVYHPSLQDGAWENTGYCGVNANVSSPLVIQHGISPATLLEWLDQPVSMQVDNAPVHSFLGSAILIANTTIYANWPHQ